MRASHRKAQGFFDVRPRYTPGSPGLVDEATAQRVAKEERESYEHALTGIVGDAEKARAEKLGLRGIVQWKQEKGSGKKQGWDVVDLVTGENLWQLCAEALYKLGWRSYHDLDAYGRSLVDQVQPADFEDYKKGWYKIEALIRKAHVYRQEVKGPA